MYYMLDERTRLAGCHMIRDNVERLIADEGVDRVKQFMREVIEDTRRSFKSTRAPRDRSPAATARPASTTRSSPTRRACPSVARRDFIVHGCYEMSFGEDGVMDVDLDGLLGLGLALDERHAGRRSRA